MKLTRKQYEKAVTLLPKLREAEKTVKDWEAALESLGAGFERMEVLEVERMEDGKYTARCKPKEVQIAPGVAGRGAA